MLKVSLNDIQKVKHFCNIAIQQDCDLTLHSGRYVIDAKSIMGIFSLDLSHPIELHIQPDIDENEMREKFKDFIV